MQDLHPILPICNNGGVCIFFFIYIFQRHPLNCIMAEWVVVIPVSTCSSSADKLCSCSSGSGKKKHWLSLDSHLCGGFAASICTGTAALHLKGLMNLHVCAGKYPDSIFIMWAHGTVMHFPMRGWCY